METVFDHRSPRHHWLSLLMTSLLCSCATTDRQTSDSDAVITDVATESVDCSFSPTTSDNLIIASTLLLPEEPKENAAVLIQKDGNIGLLGNYEDVIKAYPKASVLDCRGSTVLSPGWINAHEHTALSHAFPSPELNPNYAHRDEWLLGVNGKFKLPIPDSHQYAPDDSKSNALLLWVELRHLLAGATTIAGSGGVPGVVKNVNFQKQKFDDLIYPLQANMEIFPFSSNAIRSFAPLCSDHDGETPKLNINPDIRDIAYVPHVGEGRRDDCTAKAEIDEYMKYIGALSNDWRRFSIIHGVASSKRNFEDFASKDVTLVWSPRSNLSLYGQTVNISAAKQYGVRLALGSDWSSSGSFNMLEELVCANKVSQANGGIFNFKELWYMATYNSAYAIGAEQNTGKIQKGLRADLFLTKRLNGKQPYETAVTAKSDDVLAVWVNGKIKAAHPAIAVPMKWSDSCINTPQSTKSICLESVYFDMEWNNILKHIQNSVPLQGAYKRQAGCEIYLETE